LGIVMQEAHNIWVASLKPKSLYW